jgi:hypothetical protein
VPPDLQTSSRSATVGPVIGTSVPDIIILAEISSSILAGRRAERFQCAAREEDEGERSVAVAAAIVVVIGLMLNTFVGGRVIGLFDWTTCQFGSAKCVRFFGGQKLRSSAVSTGSSTYERGAV